MITTYDIINIIAKEHKVKCYYMGDTNANRKTNEYIEVESGLFITDKITSVDFVLIYRTLKGDPTRFYEFMAKYHTSYFKLVHENDIYEVNKLFMTIDTSTIDEFQRNTFVLNCNANVSKRPVQLSV